MTLGEGDTSKQRAVCECLHCNVPMCAKCKQRHTANPRLQSHKIVLYQQMIFNANKFAAKKGASESDNNTSVSPSRRGTAMEKSKSPKLNKNNNDGGQSMISANSSGRFSRNMFGGGGPSGTAYQNENLKQDPLEIMQCPSHEGQPLDHYSLSLREFLCR